MRKKRKKIVFLNETKTKKMWKNIHAILGCAKWLEWST